MTVHRITITECKAPLHSLACRLHPIGARQVCCSLGNGLLLMIRGCTDQSELCPAGLEKAQAFVTLVFLQLYIIFFGLGVGPICWCYLPEILPDSIKGRGASLGTCINWVFTFLVGLSFPVMLAGLKVGGSYLVYAVFNLAAFVFCFLYMVETKQKSMAQIQRQLIVGS